MLPVDSGILLETGAKGQVIVEFVKSRKFMELRSKRLLTLFDRHCSWILCYLQDLMIIM